MNLLTKSFFVEAAVAFWFLTFSGLAFALDIEGYSAALHDRFYVGQDKDFIADDIDLSGVSLNDVLGTNVGYGTWATMISDTYFITSTHSPGLSENPLGLTKDHRFYQDHDASSGSVYWSSEESSVSASDTQVFGDLRLGRFDVAPPAWVKRYPLLKRPDISSLEYNYNGLPDVNSELTVVGLNHSITGGNNFIPSLNSVLVGYSRVVGPESLVSLLLSNGNIIPTLAYKHQATAGIQDQAIVINGDSGAPSFTMIGGIGPVLTGVHSSPTYDTSVSSYLSDIEQVVSSAGESVTIVTDFVGDANADFQVNFQDSSILSTNFDQPGTYEQGDLNLDGMVNFQDASILSTNFGGGLGSIPADFNDDQAVNHLDFEIIALNWGQTGLTPGEDGDADWDGDVDVDDVVVFDNLWIVPDAPMPEVPFRITGDVNLDGIVGSYEAAQLANGIYNSTGLTPYTDGDLDGDGDYDVGDVSVLSAHYGTILADADGDGDVDLDDVIIVANNWGPNVTGGRSQGDFNGDQIVDSLDMSSMATLWRFGYIAADRGQGSAVPESAAQLSMAILLGLGTLFQRRIRVE